MAADYRWHGAAPATWPPAGPARRLAWLLCLGVPPAIGLLGLALGKDASWDFLNYHWYNPYAFLTGRLGLDIAVGHQATYTNPLIDVPFFLLARHLPGAGAGFALATVQGLNFVLLFLIAHAVLRPQGPLLRVAAAAGTALAGLLGGGVLGQLGVSGNDNLVSLAVLGSLLVVVVRHGTILAGAPLRGLLWAALAGLLAGSAVGLKLTAGPYPVGLCAAFLVLPAPFWRRLLAAFVFGFGVLAGFAAFAGPWMWVLWEATGNPLFPYFNHVFQSPLLPSVSFRDVNFLPRDPLVALFFPVFFSLDSFRVAEWFFRDVKLMLVYLLAPVSLWWAWRRPGAGQDGFVDRVAARYLLAGAAVAYVVWELMWSIYRYLLTLEMLAPLLIAVLLGLLPLKPSSRLWALAGLLVLAQLVARAEFDKRLPWPGAYVEVQGPELPRPQASLVLVAGVAPMSFVIPSFPSGVPFLRIHGWMIQAEGPQSGYALEMRRRVAAHAGDLYALFSRYERVTALAALASYGLALEQDSCADLPSNVDRPLVFCRARRSY